MPFEPSAELTYILATNSSQLYDNMKQHLVNTEEFFDTDIKQFFDGINMVTSDGLNLLDEIDDLKFLSQWLRDCNISHFFLFDDEETICKLFRLFYIFPIFDDGPYVSRNTKTVGNSSLLMRQLKDVMPSVHSTLIDEDYLKDSFKVVERRLIESWTTYNSKYALIEMFNACRTALGTYDTSHGADADAPHRESKVQTKIVSSLGKVIEILVSRAESQANDTIEFETRINEELKCPMYPDMNDDGALEGCIVYSDIIFEAIKTLTTLEVKPSNLIHLMDIQRAASDRESVKIFKEVLAQALCSQHLPIFLHDGQNLLMFDITEDQYTPVIDGEGNIRIPFKYFKIENTSNDSNRYKSSTSINALVPLLLSILDVSSNSTRRLVELSKFIIKDARQRREIYIDLLKTSKDESYLRTDSWSTMKSTETSPSSSSNLGSGLEINSQINEFKDHVKLESKRVYTSERIPVLHEHLRSSEYNSMITLVVDAKLNAAILKINEPVYSNKMIMKILSIDASHAYYCKNKYKCCDENGNTVTLVTFLATAYHETFLNELAINLFIDHYNENCTKEDATINKPKILDHGEIMSCNYRGFYFIEEYLDFIDNKPKTESDIQNGLDRLKVLHSLGVAHLDIAKRNLCLDHNDQVWFIDFGQSTIISERDRREHEFADISMMTRLE